MLKSFALEPFKIYLSVNRGYQREFGVIVDGGSWNTKLPVSVETLMYLPSYDLRAVALETTASDVHRIIVGGEKLQKVSWMSLSPKITDRTDF